MNHPDIGWLTAFLKYNPSLYICLESRSLQASKSISAGIISDIENKTNIIIVNVDLSWLDKFKMKKITPIMGVTSEPVSPPLIIVKSGEELEEVHFNSVAQILLTNIEGIATHITFPWIMDDLWMLDNANKWIFVSIENLIDEQIDTFHWGYGDFESFKVYEKYFYSNLKFPS